jgi:hypothetical protein
MQLSSARPPRPGQTSLAAAVEVKATTDSSPADDLDVKASRDTSYEVAELGAFVTAVLDVGAEDDPRRPIPLLEHIALSLDQIWNEARDCGLPGDFGRLDKASRCLHRSLVSLREHVLERSGSALFDQDIVGMSERRNAMSGQLRDAVQPDDLAEGTVIAGLPSIWPDGAA